MSFRFRVFYRRLPSSWVLRCRSRMKSKWSSEMQGRICFWRSMARSCIAEERKKSVSCCRRWSVLREIASRRISMQPDDRDPADTPESQRLIISRAESQAEMARFCGVLWNSICPSTIRDDAPLPCGYPESSYDFGLVVSIDSGSVGHGGLSVCDSRITARS